MDFLAFLLIFGILLLCFKGLGLIIKTGLFILSLPLILIFSLIFSVLFIALLPVALVSGLIALVLIPLGVLAPLLPILLIVAGIYLLLRQNKRQSADQ
jgi:uncharacterized membrane protein